MRDREGRGRQKRACKKRRKKKEKRIRYPDRKREPDLAGRWTRGPHGQGEVGIEDSGTRKNERRAKHIEGWLRRGRGKKRNEPCGAWWRREAARKFFFLTKRDLVQRGATVGKKKKDRSAKGAQDPEAEMR